MAITYTYPDHWRTAQLPISVLLDGRKVGEIQHITRDNQRGYCYFPKGDCLGGECFPTLSACQKSLEEE